MCPADSEGCGAVKSDKTKQQGDVTVILALKSLKYMAKSM